MGSRTEFGKSELCAACKKLNVPNLVNELEVLPYWRERRSDLPKARGMAHLPDARRLPISATTCSMCRLILDAILQERGVHKSVRQLQRIGSSALHITEGDDLSQEPSEGVRGCLAEFDTLCERDIAQLQEHLTDGPIYLQPAKPRNGQPPVFPGEDVAGANHVHGIRISVPVQHEVLTGYVRLFALRDTPAALSCDVIGRPPLPSSDSPEAYGLINRWMGDCLAKHDACKKTLSGATIDDALPPILPRRIIHVGRPNEAISPRLIETHGETSHYVALSHCLGHPTDNPPLTTTQTTLESHVSNVSFDSLPKAYQDAIVATHRLGFEYIWIDSLCIIRDSDADRFYNLSCKGTVFQSARLVIAASHATNNTEPCFFQRSALPPDIELQHVSRAGKPEGSVFAGLRPNDNASLLPECSPLATYSNATEELLLSRRIIFYTPSSLIWSCKQINQRETGNSFHSTSRNPVWRVLVEKHTARRFPNPGDRLTSLEEVRSELGKRRTDSVYCFGLWQNEMPLCLLWYCLKPARRAKSGIRPPTWTWASTTCSILFINMGGIAQAPNECRGLRFDESSKTLAFSGVIKRIPRYAPTTEHPRWDKATAEEVLATLETLHGYPLDDQKGYILDDDGAVIGWAFLDEPDAPNIGLRCVRVMRKTLTKHNTMGAVKRKLYRDWILLLSGSEDDFGRFQRLGVGVLTTVERWFEDEAATQIYLG